MWMQSLLANRLRTPKSCHRRRHHHHAQPHIRLSRVRRRLANSFLAGGPRCVYSSLLNYSIYYVQPAAPESKKCGKRVVPSAGLGKGKRPRSTGSDAESDIQFPVDDRQLTTPARPNAQRSVRKKRKAAHSV